MTDYGVVVPDEPELTAFAPLLDRARKAWPQLQVDGEAFAQQLRGIVSAKDTAQNPGALWVEDLYLAAAALFGDRCAVAALDERVTAQARSAARALGQNPAFGDELSQEVRCRLLIVEAGQARLAGYRGQGSLDGWLRVVATRLGISILRRKQPEAIVEGEGVELWDPFRDPLRSHMRKEYRAAVVAGLKAGVRALPPRERILLRLHYGEGVGLDALGRMYKVHFSTVSRWLTRARTQILDTCRATIATEFGLSEADSQELIAQLTSQLEIGLTTLLGKAPAPADATK